MGPRRRRRDHTGRSRNRCARVILVPIDLAVAAGEGHRLPRMIAYPQSKDGRASFEQARTHVVSLKGAEQPTISSNPMAVLRHCLTSIGQDFPIADNHGFDRPFRCAEAAVDTHQQSFLYQRVERGLAFKYEDFRGTCVGVRRYRFRRQLAHPVHLSQQSTLISRQPAGFKGR